MSVLEKLIPLADRHRELDQYISGTYWSEDGGCSVGGTIHDAIRLKLLPKNTDHGSHRQLAAATGLPEMLWRRRAAGDEPSESEWSAAWQQADAAWKQAYAAWKQAYAAWQQFWSWCADMVCEELARS